MQNRINVNKQDGKIKIVSGFVMAFHPFIKNDLQKFIFIKKIFVMKIHNDNFFCIHIRCCQTKVLTISMHRIYYYLCFQKTAVKSFFLLCKSLPPIAHMCSHRLTKILLKIKSLVAVIDNKQTVST